MRTPVPPANEVRPSDEERAEAAIWIARLHDEQRTPDLNARVQGWLAESEAHRAAFERMTRTWEQTAAIRSGVQPDGMVANAKRAKLKHWALPLVACVLLGSVIMTFRLSRANMLVTDIGQQQVRVLPDGTRVMLNTDTRIKIDYDRQTRLVRLIRGEAWFDVSKRPAWPFVVDVDGQSVRALGTSFVVRHDDIQPFSVTLVEGQVSVTTRSPGNASSQQTLAPGQRLIRPAQSAAVVDRPDISRATAWERGRIEFEDTPLRDAAEEMNRYSKIPIVISDPQIVNMRIGGVFRAGDSHEFARVASVALQLQVDQQHDKILLRAAAPPL